MLVFYDLSHGADLILFIKLLVLIGYEKFIATKKGAGSNYLIIPKGVKYFSENLTSSNNLMFSRGRF